MNFEGKGKEQFFLFRKFYASTNPSFMKTRWVEFEDIPNHPEEKKLFYRNPHSLFSSFQCLWNGPPLLSLFRKKHSRKSFFFLSIHLTCDFFFFKNVPLNIYVYLIEGRNDLQINCNSRKYDLRRAKRFKRGNENTFKMCKIASILIKRRDSYCHL